MLKNPIDYQLVADRIGDIRETISLKSSNPVTVVAVTKGFGIDAARAAAQAGVYDIGENYAQEIIKKRGHLESLGEAEAYRWHFIGALQRNKVRKISNIISMWQSIDSFALGDEVAKRCEGPKILVQVNMAGSKTQGGVPADEVPTLVERFHELDIHVEGLMTIGANGDREATLMHFRNLKELSNSLGLTECSMGMSDDYDLALEAGATILRLGRSIFGNRDAD